MKKQTKQSVASLFGVNKTARVGAIWATATLFLAVALIVLNLLLGLLPYHVSNPDLTGSGTFRLSTESKKWLKTLDEDVTVYLVVSGGESKAQGDLYGFLQQYASQSKHITVKVIDSGASGAFLTETFGVDLNTLSDMSVIVSSAERYRVIDYLSLSYYVFKYSSNGYTYTEFRMSASEMANIRQSALEEDPSGATYTAMFTSGMITPYFDGDSRITNAINFVTQNEVAKVYWVESSGSASAVIDSTFRDLLEQGCYGITKQLNLQTIPSDCDLLVINNPTVDIGADEAAALADYLANGGKLYLATSYIVGKLPNLAGVLAAYGLGFEDSMKPIGDNHSANKIASGVFFADVASQHAATGDFDGSFVVSAAHAVTVTETENVTVTPWITTSDQGYLIDIENPNTVPAQKQEYTLGVIAESGETQILWLASPLCFTGTYNTYSDNGNFTLALSAFNSMTGIANDGLIISGAAIDNAILTCSVGTFAVWALILVVLIPIGVAVLGTVIWYSRKKR